MNLRKPRVVRIGGLRIVDRDPSLLTPTLAAAYHLAADENESIDALLRKLDK